MTRSNRSSSWMRHPSRLEVAIEMAGRKKLAGKPLTADEEALLARAGDRKPRARPTRYEAADAEQVAQAASTRWWGPGLYRHEQSEGNWRQGAQQQREGQRPGWPDFTLWIPEREVGPPPHSPSAEWVAKGGLGPRVDLPAIRAALELKRGPRTALCPDGEWWLDWDLGTTKQGTMFKLSRAQARTLQLLDACGLRTMVAYGADEAIAWLDEIAGPRPERLPEGW